jgi:hypothetical protein
LNIIARNNVNSPATDIYILCRSCQKDVTAFNLKFSLDNKLIVITFEYVVLNNVN